MNSIDTHTGLRQKWVRKEIASDFLAAIEAEPDNPEPKLLFADWLEERGERGDEALALAFRVAADRGWKPIRQMVTWSWYDRDRDARLLPEALYQAVCDAYDANRDNWSLLDAFRRLAKALEKVELKQ